MKVPSGSNIHSCCITDEDRLQNFKKTFCPTHVIHCAGVCDLDVCEERPAWAYAMNATGSKVVADVFGEQARIIYMSADLVFSGNNAPEYGYNESCIPDPLSVVGKTMAAAESEILKCDNSCVIRLGLPIGQSVTATKGAVDFIAGRLSKRLPVSLFYDEYRSCILCSDIVKAIQKVLKADLRGIWHMGGPRKYSLYDIGDKVCARNGFDPFYLKGQMRKDEKCGPPRMGDVSLDSSRIQKELGIEFLDPFEDY